jgi:hypothetical protein
LNTVPSVKWTTGLAPSRSSQPAGEHLAQHLVLAGLADGAQRHAPGPVVRRRREGRERAEAALLDGGHAAGRAGERDRMPGRSGRARDGDERVEMASAAGEREQDPHGAGPDPSGG